MLDTTTPTVPGGGSALPLGGQAGSDAGDGVPGDPETGLGSRGPSARTWWLIGSLVGLVVVVGLAVNLIELDKVTIGPGGARPVEGLVQIGDGGETFPAEGDILFTTVSLDDTVTVWDGLMGWLDDDVAVFDKAAILGDRDEEESRQFNQELMEDSKITAIRVALERLGYDPASGTGALVSAVDPQQPAADVLDGGETVVAVDGDPLELGDDLVAAVGEREPGDDVTITVEEPDGEVRDETVELGERPDLPGEAYLGIGVGTRDFEFDLPFEIDIDSGEVGGPSAGLAFTLAVLDVLTPGELTGGVEVATTGTMNGLGQVGRVGGVAQKTAAVRAVGATLFLVPEAEVEDAQAAAGDDVDVVGVATLDDALAALAARGGDVGAVEALAP